MSFKPTPAQLEKHAAMRERFAAKNAVRRAQSEATTDATASAPVPDAFDESVEEPSELDTADRDDLGAEAPPNPTPAKSSGSLSIWDITRRPLLQAAITKVVERHHAEVRKPRKDEWFRTIAIPNLDNLVVDVLDVDGSSYVVTQDVVATVPAPTFAARPLLCVSRSRTLFVWLVRIVDPADAKPMKAHVDAAKAADLAALGWVRMWWCPQRMARVIETPEGEIAEPKVPECDVAKVFEAAVAEVLIDSSEHPVLLRLRGKA